jgi:O-antigen/teichoic acid export membrane protein
MLLLAQLFSLACGPVGNILNMCGLERSMFKINLINVMASAVILLILVPLWGINGVGVSVLVGTLYSNLAAIYVARKKMGIKWWSEKVKRWIVPSIFSVVSLIFIYANLTSINASVLISVLIIIYIAFFFAQFACYGVDNDDREVFEMLMNRMRISHKKIPNQLDR